MRYPVIVEVTDGGYSPYSPDLSGYVTAGDTREKTLMLIREAIAFHLEGLREDEQAIPPPDSTAE